MPNYRRAFVPGGTWFFTVNLLDRNSNLLTENIDSLREAVRETKQRYPFDIVAMVILPDHIHAIWTLPDGDADFSVRWRWIKIRFSKSVSTGEPLSAVRQARRERGIWQRRYWEHLIRDARDLHGHINYCWFNPVKHGLVANIEDWPFSSFHREHRDMAHSGNFEKAVAEYALQNSQFGERETS